jgi:hypothetical protein
LKLNFRIFNTNEKRETGKIEENSSKIYSMVLLNDDSKLFYGTFNHKIKVYDTESESVEAVLKGHSNNIWVLKVSDDDRYLFSGSEDCTVKVWDITQKYKKIITIDHGAKVLNLVIMKSNKGIVFGGAKYESIKKVDLKKLKWKKNQKNEEIKKHKKKKIRPRSSKKNINILTNVEDIDKISDINPIWIPDHIKTNKYFQKNLSAYYEWLTLLQPFSKEDAVSLLMFISMEQERNLQLTTETRQLLDRLEQKQNEIRIIKTSETKLIQQISECEIRITQLTVNHQKAEQEKKMEISHIQKEISENKELKKRLEESEISKNKLKKENEELIEKLSKIKNELEQKKRTTAESDYIYETRFKELKSIHENKMETFLKEKTILKKKLEEMSKLNNQLNRNLEGSVKSSMNMQLAQMQEMQKSNSLLQLHSKNLENTINTLKFELEGKNNTLVNQRQLFMNLQNETHQLKNSLSRVQRESMIESRKAKEDPYTKKLISHLENDLKEYKRLNRNLQQSNDKLKSENLDLKNQLKNQTINLKNIRNSKSSFDLKLQDFKNKNENLIFEIEKVRKRMLRSRSENNFVPNYIQSSKKVSFGKKERIFSNTGQQVGAKYNYGVKRSNSSTHLNNKMDLIFSKTDSIPEEKDFYYRVSNQSKRIRRFEKSTEKQILTTSWMNRF